MSVGSALIIFSMIVLNAMFAAFEIALASVSIGRLQALADQHRRGARAALKMKQNIEGSLAVIQLGITLVGSVAAATGGASAEERLSPLLVQYLGVTNRVADFLGLALVVLPLSAAMIVVGELIPKVFALKNKEWVSLRLSPLMMLMTAVAKPAVWALETTSTGILDWVSRLWQPRVEGHRNEVAEIEELRAIVALARTSRLIGGQEERIILGAARLSNRKISEIMIPVSEIVSLDLSHTMAESLVIAHNEMHTRFPVCAEPGDLQTICGYVNFKDIVSELRLSPNQPSLRGIMRAIPSLPDDITIATALQRLTVGHVHIALVRNNDAEIVGLVTLEDILEELVGDIQDEYDRMPAHVIEAGAGWVMGGGTSLERLESATGVQIDRTTLPPDTRSLHDWVRGRLDRTVHGGDIVRADGLRVLVRKVRRQKVLEAQVSLDERQPRAPKPESESTTPAA
ncbi:MAG: HlyC/CorC family transporter [Planctomycetes bacterium]|nr:HlyC/CorC family transporter [Planctomycetota bacterium]